MLPLRKLHPQETLTETLNVSLADSLLGRRNQGVGRTIDNRTGSFRKMSNPLSLYGPDLRSQLGMQRNRKPEDWRVEESISIHSSIFKAAVKVWGQRDSDNLFQL
ncbi:hypothetical protein CDAR_510531 [Caerostris darwini]|uniref:Uncharacterized protein n=1 Tax=Caerostris darwini TaxID=1538125 RepID=A0AAV4UG61_9ARAC|nr:hypothetical protein CDAR_510531 [Caerostris darwini]